MQKKLIGLRDETVEQLKALSEYYGVNKTAVICKLIEIGFEELGDKERFTIHIPKTTIKGIKERALELGKTERKYIEDLVELDLNPNYREIVREEYRKLFEAGRL